jgi:FtsZ-binding cell division protein ZapB
LLSKYSKIIRRTRNENDELQNENDSLSSKLENAHKTSDELKDQNKIMSSTLKELKTSNKELRDEHDKLEKKHDELITRLNLLKDEYTILKINYNSLIVANELALETHDAINQVIKIDIATSCDDLIIENFEQGSSGKDKNVVESDNYDDYVKLKSENEMLRNENKKLIALEKQTSNESLIEENKKIKQEKEHLKTGLSKFTRGQYLQIELLMNTVMKIDRSGIGYLAN